MGCDITKGINGTDCLNAVAGFRNAYIANFDDYDFTTSSTENGHLLEGIPMGFETFKFPLKNTGNTYSEPSSSSRDTGTTTFNGTLNLVFTKVEAKKMFQIMQMIWGRPIVFLETNGGDFIAVGLKRGVEFNNTSVIEGEMDGTNAFQLEGTTQEAMPFYFLEEATVDALKASVVTA